MGYSFNFRNQYPYTNFHELNLDWVMDTVQEISEKVDQWEEKVLREAKLYTDQEVSAAKQELYEALDNLDKEITQEIQDFEYRTNEAITAQNDKLDAAIKKVDTTLAAYSGIIDQKIAANNQYLFDLVSSGLSNLSVINPFTGQKTSIQNMFNYFAAFHLDNAITYAAMRDRLQSYETLAAAKITYIQLVNNGKTVFPGA